MHEKKDASFIYCMYIAFFMCVAQSAYIQFITSHDKLLVIHVRYTTEFVGSMDIREQKNGVIYWNRQWTLSNRLVFILNSLQLFIINAHTIRTALMSITWGSKPQRLHNNSNEM